MPFISYAVSFILILSLAVTPVMVALTIWLSRGQFTYVSGTWIMAFIALLYATKKFIGSGMPNEDQNKVLKYIVITTGSLGFLLDAVVVFRILTHN